MFKLEFKTDNAAFFDDEGNYAPEFEIRRILQAWNDTKEGTGLTAGFSPVVDLNGNTIGHWSLTEE